MNLMKNIKHFIKITITERKFQIVFGTVET